ncbi:MAG: sigma-70 family RNA polymerase sigma factor [Oscillospiraceae bacterium]|nr:sigma-70 family RNA polymerase sigma factor [Oscillospiraceae bacterium]
MADKTELLHRLTTEYLPAFLAFAIKNTNNLPEAEELAQETAFQCVLAINKTESIANFNAFVWSIAHNTYKRWYARKRHASLDDESMVFANVLIDTTPIEEEIILAEEKNAIKLELSRQSGLYRKALVCFYYEELSIAETAAKLGISVEMAKFYLQKGRQKLKEAYTMSIGEKSFNPLEFSVYMSSMDMAGVNVWNIFKRKLPGQIAHVCHDSDKSISEISTELGVSAVFIEEEVDLLMDAGVMISPARGKYRTNLHILKKNAVAELKAYFDKLNEAYVPVIQAAFKKHLSEMKTLGIFKQEVCDSRYAWLFAERIKSFDFGGHSLSSDEYPKILSCGCRGFIFAEGAKGSPWIGGRTPVALDNCTVLPTDFKLLGGYRHQNQLPNSNKAKSQALYDVYTGNAKESDTELYAELIKEGYVVKQGDELFCNVAVITPAANALFDSINTKLKEFLAPLCKDFLLKTRDMIHRTLPPQLKAYTKGYTGIWVSTYSCAYLYEALCDSGFLVIPEEGELTPVACTIVEK